MANLARAYYHSSIKDFLASSDEAIFGHISKNCEFPIDLLLKRSWIEELEILKFSLNGFNGKILLEYSIPRMGRRADAILLFPQVVIVVEFKVGEKSYTSYALDQVTDYALDLKNFQKESHDKAIVPLLLATNAVSRPLVLKRFPDSIYEPVCVNQTDFGPVLREIILKVNGPQIDPSAWINSGYSPTPTIIEAAQALYQKHDVKEISRSEAGAENLTKTAEAITEIVADARNKKRKSICFITGVPGAGKTLAGLNIANSHNNPGKEENAVFLSGNGPLVDVLREALVRDDVRKFKESGEKPNRSDILRRVKAFIQNIHHFRDEALASDDPPNNRVAIFDEAQRAWNLNQTAAFMKRRKGIPGFNQSEPQFLISYMNRHIGWATIICLIGGGQEINTGEAGLYEWFKVLSQLYPEWHVYISENLSDTEYLNPETQNIIDRLPLLNRKSNLHLATSIRSFRAETVSEFVKNLLDCSIDDANRLMAKITSIFPIFLTRNINDAKYWLRQKARGTERYGIIASSEGLRLKPFSINVKAEIDPKYWFLNDKFDIRSSYYLEDVATEFQIQGLELDWTCVAWDANFRFGSDGWEYYYFRGNRWMKIKSIENQKYLKNAYRVLLTRARRG